MYKLKNDEVVETLDEEGVGKAVYEIIDPEGVEDMVLAHMFRAAREAMYAIECYLYGQPGISDDPESNWIPEE